MKIGLDLDGTITDLPILFEILSKSLMRAGHEVHVITYRDILTLKETRRELKELRIRYSQLHMPGDDDEMSDWKARKARELGLDVMIDDSPEVLAGLPPEVKRVWICSPEIYDLKLCIKGLRNGMF